eukprot:2046355-Pleurochrysis_carterae.AAC.1
MKILLVLRPRRQNAYACGLALSFAPLRARLNRRKCERAGRLLPCVPTPLKSASGAPDSLSPPPNGTSVSNATDHGEVDRTESISAITSCACYCSCSSRERDSVGARVGRIRIKRYRNSRFPL